ncbi:MULTISPECIES: globin domain-containing protein [unclassified Streptomyces]|uniref:globin domain-containing protein n=1 Tax=unclassified Streptomyces TaxID=2593676 RepID=UPI000BD7CAD8|nr:MULTISPECIES: globin domain-containing protein [unclassified Streptomyces]SOD46567.1 NAD(P)H-flavin reductase [Streptomyces sp. Ag82_G6-1]
MDAPTTTSADNGTSGGEGGWFTPRKNPTTAPDSDAGTADRSAEGRRPAAIRPVGRPGAAPEAPADDTPTAPADASTGAPDQGREAPESIPRSAPPAAQHAPSPAASSLATATSPGPVPTALTPTPFASTVAPPPTAAAEEHVPAQRTAPVPPAEEATPAPAEAGTADAVLIRRAMAEVAPVSDKVTSYFYALLFVRHPDLRSLFPAAMDTQRDRLLRALLTAAEHIDNKDVLVDYLQNLGRGHRKYGTRAEHYPAVGECLIGALSKYAAGVWNPEMEAAWVRAYTTISQVMIDAAAADELRAPAWWYAEIVTHDMRTSDVAVVTVRPDQPYPFLAGQYTSLETPWWPRIWRHYSFASAPRSDGLLSFHVKAVPAGWVSNALVHRARPGDIIRLGPPAGAMTVDHTTDSGLLCVGGGTGIAPIKALVEDVAEHGERRSVEVFYGARTDHDLYDIDTMLRLQQTHPWLSVRAIIDQQAHQQLPDAVRAYGPWNEFDAYLSGPPGMIRSGVNALRDSGIPSDRIRHDSVEELVAAGS